MSGRALAVVILIALGVNGSIQGDCTWTPTTTTLTTACAGVGIGTPAPQRKLHLVGSAGAVSAFPLAALGASDLLVLENNANANLSFIVGDNGQSTIRFVRNGASAFGGAITYVHGYNENFMSLWTTSVERMRIGPDGNVGIGTSSPAAKLHVAGPELFLANMPPDGTTPSTTMFTLGNRAASGGSFLWRLATASSAGGAGLYPNALEIIEYPNDPSLSYCCFQRIQVRPVTSGLPKIMVIDGAGNVSIGAGSPAAALHVNGNGRFDGSLAASGSMGVGTISPDSTKKLHVVGDARFDGTVTGTNIRAHYQDLAEWVPSQDDLAPGTVVVVDAAVGNGVTASAAPYDTSVAGVVSAQPGIILGEAAASREMVATTGRVKVKVDATRAPIAAGDLLVTSNRRGVAMKSEPIEINGRKFHQPGTIIGKALEPLPSGTGEILVLLSLQ